MLEVIANDDLRKPLIHIGNLPSLVCQELAQPYRSFLARDLAPI